jgi:hypothetical protein
MKKYQRLAEQIPNRLRLAYGSQAIAAFLREQVVSSGMSFMTVGHLPAAGKPGADCRPAAVGLLCRRAPRT